MIPEIGLYKLRRWIFNR